MAEESLIEGEDENILYDLLVITEWPPETDTQVSSTHLGRNAWLPWSVYLCATLLERRLQRVVRSKPRSTKQQLYRNPDFPIMQYAD